MSRHPGLGLTEAIRYFHGATRACGLLEGRGAVSNRAGIESLVDQAAGYRRALEETAKLPLPGDAEVGCSTEPRALLALWLLEAQALCGSGWDELVLAARVGGEEPSMTIVRVVRCTPEGLALRGSPKGEEIISDIASESEGLLSWPDLRRAVALRGPVTAGDGEGSLDLESITFRGGRTGSLVDLARFHRRGSEWSRASDSRSARRR